MVQEPFPPTQDTRPILEKMKGWAVRFLRESKETAKATWGQSVRLFYYARTLWIAWKLRREATKAQIMLGRTMYAASQGDTDIRSRITAVEQQIDAVQAAKQPTRSLKSERQRLLLKLGSSFTEHSTAAETEDQYLRLKSLSQKVQSQEETSTKARAILLPPDGVGWRRIILGYGVICLVVWFVLRPSGNPSNRSGAGFPSTKEIAADGKGEPLFRQIKTVGDKEQIPSTEDSREAKGVPKTGVQQPTDQPETNNREAASDSGRSGDVLTTDFYPFQAGMKLTYLRSVHLQTESLFSAW